MIYAMMSMKSKDYLKTKTLSCQQKVHRSCSANAVYFGLSAEDWSSSIIKSLYKMDSPSFQQSGHTHTQKQHKTALLDLQIVGSSIQHDWIITDQLSTPRYNPSCLGSKAGSTTAFLHRSSDGIGPCLCSSHPICQPQHLRARNVGTPRRYKEPTLAISTDPRDQ